MAQRKPRPHATKRHRDPQPERTAWHVLFERLVLQRAPGSFEVRPEVPLGNARPQLDLLLLRRRRGVGADARARVLRQLWRQIDEQMVLEFKSVARPVRPGELLRLLAYTALHVDESRKGRAAGVRMGLVVTNSTPTLASELRTLGGRLPQRRCGYAVVKLRPFDLVLAVIDEVATSERDDLLGFFGHGEHLGVRDRIWWNRETGRAMPMLKSLPDHESFLKKALKYMSAKEVIRGLSVADLERYEKAIKEEKLRLRSMSKRTRRRPARKH
jgi:hypothetical protein